MDPASVHNAFLATSNMYGLMLAAQMREIELLRKQNQELTKILAQYAATKAAEVPNDRKNQGRVDGTERGGQAALQEGPLTNGS